MKRIISILAVAALLATPAFAVSLKKATNQEAKLDVRIPVVQANIVTETARGKTAVVVKLTRKLTKLQSEEVYLEGLYPGL